MYTKCWQKVLSDVSKSTKMKTKWEALHLNKLLINSIYPGLKLLKDFWLEETTKEKD